MARITDINRIKRLKESTMKLVVDNGFGGASAAMIAVNAKLSAGYFYMHYKGKYELVNSLLQEVFSEAVGKIEEFLESGHSFSSIVKLIVEYIFHLANEDPVKMKFLYVLSNDYNFVIDPNIRDEVYGFLKRLKVLGQETHALDEKITEADLYMLLLVSPIQYINMRFKFFLSKESLTPEDQDHMLYIIQKVLIQNR